MKSKEVKIKGITYKVSSTTEAGLKDAVRMLKKSLKQIEKNQEEDGRV